VLDGSIAISFFLCMISGLYFSFIAQRGPTNEVWLFTRTTWDLIHTWSGVIMTIAAILHFILHWKWVTNITRKVFSGWTKLQTQQTVTTTVESN
jgi:cytochrome b subunit of formate dehydrogenase